MHSILRPTLVAGGLILALSLPLTAVAQSTGAQSMGPYLGGSFGMTSVDVCDDLGFLGLTECDDSDTGFKVFGGYRINDNFAAEVGFVDLGEVTVSGPGGSASVETDGFQFAGLGVIPLNSQFELFAKLGLFMWDVSASGPTGSASDDGNDLMFGAGAAWNFTEQVAARIEWERFDVDGDDVDFWSLGVQFNF
jgi:OOP family OmpA-OmpF porin